MPPGPPSLCADTDSRSAPRSSKAMASWPAAAQASTWTSTPRSRQAATTSATGCTVPTSWLPHCTWTREVSGRTAASSSSASIRPKPSTPTTVTSPLASRSEEHTSELQSLMRISYAVFCLKKKQQHYNQEKEMNLPNLHLHSYIQISLQ